MAQPLTDLMQRLRHLTSSDTGTTRHSNRGRRAGQRAARRRLQRELAGFRTPAERSELEAILARHSNVDTTEVRAALARQASLDDLSERGVRWLGSA